MRRVYIDSNVFISLIDREIGKNARGLFVEAERFFERVREQGAVLVLSDLFFEEIASVKRISKDFILDYFKNEGISVLEVSKAGPSVKPFTERGIHFKDVLHVSLALNSNCDCIVTFNIKDFEGAFDLIEVLEPADF